MSDYRWAELCLEGRELDDEGGRELLQALERAPEDVVLRVKQVGWLGRQQSPRGAELLWLVTHHPEVDLKGFAFFRREQEPEAFDAICEAWEGHVSRSPDDASLLQRAAQFMRFERRERAEALMRRCVELQSAVPRWTESLANLLLARSADPAPRDVQRALASESLALYERALSLEPADLSGHLHLLSIARAARMAGQVERSAEAAERVLDEAARFERTWQYGNSIHDANLVLGHLALDAGDVAGAEEKLRAAGQTRGSPQLDTFGPDLSLASRLLEAGVREPVQAYLTDCQRFWTSRQEALNQAIERIGRGDVGPLDRTDFRSSS